MADLYGTTTPSPPANPSEDISTFLHHLLHSSSSSSYMPFKTKPMQPPIVSPPPDPNSEEDFHRFDGFRDGTRMESPMGLNLSDPGFYFPANVKEGTDKMISSLGGVDSDANASSPRRRGFSAENDLGDFSCDSEGTGGVLQGQLNPVPSSRPSSKRTRAAEVHNLSEKRRRSKINEKMKALQNLIPNSNKTDKASMLDEAIEYLKQLQLQVQMLSMRNGISLHPMCLPGVLQSQLSQIGMSLDEGSGFLSSNRESHLFPATQERPMQAVFDVSNQDTSNQQNDMPSATNITDTESPFGFEQDEYERFHLPSPPKVSPTHK